MWAQSRPTSHHGGWRRAQAYRTPGERASNVLWWAVIAATVVAAVTYGIYLFQ